MACSAVKLSTVSVFVLLSVLTTMLFSQMAVAGRPLDRAATHRAAAPSKRQSTEEANHSAEKKQPAGGTVEGGAGSGKKETECLDHEGTVLIPGVGRYMVGSVPQMPSFGDTFVGDSVPAAVNSRYLPGNDDTFVPNPGYEVPNPFQGTSP